jgi:hypothetical protein
MTYDSLSEGRVQSSIYEDMAADAMPANDDKDVWGWTKRKIIQHNGVYKPWFHLVSRQLVLLEKSQICRDLGAIQRYQVWTQCSHCALHGSSFNPPFRSANFDPLFILLR